MRLCILLALPLLRMMHMLAGSLGDRTFDSDERIVSIQNSGHMAGHVTNASADTGGEKLKPKRKVTKAADVHQIELDNRQRTSGGGAAVVDGLLQMGMNESRGSSSLRGNQTIQHDNWVGGCPNICVMCKKITDEKKKLVVDSWEVKITREKGTKLLWTKFAKNALHTVTLGVFKGFKDFAIGGLKELNKMEKLPVVCDQVHYDDFKQRGKTEKRNGRNIGGRFHKRDLEDDKDLDKFKKTFALHYTGPIKKKEMAKRTQDKISIPKLAKGRFLLDNILKKKCEHVYKYDPMMLHNALSVGICGGMGQLEGYSWDLHDCDKVRK